MTLIVNQNRKKIYKPSNLLTLKLILVPRACTGSGMLVTSPSLLPPPPPHFVKFPLEERGTVRFQCRAQQKQHCDLARCGTKTSQLQDSNHWITLSPKNSHIKSNMT